MKKFLIAVATTMFIFGGQTQAAPVDDLNANLDTQDIKSHGKWAHFRDKYILGRETENERRDRKEWERRHRDDYNYKPPKYRGEARYYPPQPPPYYRKGKRYYPPSTPPPYHRDNRRYSPPPPPTRYR